MNKLKIAIFYDWLNQWGGAERVLLNLITLYPQAELYTLVHDPIKTTWLPKNIKVHTTFINNLPYAKSNPIFYTPLYNLAIEQFDFSGFDIVISTTSTIGHGLLVPPTTLFVCYFHNINRHVYLNPPFILKPILRLYQKIDKILVHRPDSTFCNSNTVAQRLNNFFHLFPSKIHPGIDLQKFKPSNIPKSNFYLIVGRQVEHKKIDLIINYFLIHPEKKLVIAGNGRIHNKLLKLANSATNIIFITNPTDTKLVQLYQQAIALICPQLEDFGLTPIEAQACGTPVIAYGRGGNTETIVNQKTGIFFNYQNIKSLSIAMTNFEKRSFSPKICRQNSLKFSQQSFMLKFNYHLIQLWKKNQINMLS